MVDAPDPPSRAYVEQFDHGIAEVVPRDGERAAVRAEGEPVNRVTAVRSVRGPRSPPRDGVVQLDAAVLSPDGEQPAVGPQGHDARLRPGRRQHADGGRRAQERRQEGVACVWRVLQGDGLAGEQEGAVEPVRGLRLGAEPLGVGRQGTVARGAALVERDEPGDDREDE